MSQSNLIVFQAISNFTKCLAEIYGSEQKSLALYERLINHTTLSHADAIEKHIAAFRAFCTTNRDKILEQNDKELDNPSIVYSPRVYINLKPIFEKADEDTKSTIWSHLVSILALVDKTSSSLCKDALAKLMTKIDEPTPESDDFISNIMNKVEKHVKPDASPQEAMASIFSSGIISELMTSFTTGMQNGQMDVGKLMGSVQKMMGGIQGEEAPEGAGDMMGMMTNMMGMLGGGAGKGPNIAELMKDLNKK